MLRNADTIGYTFIRKIRLAPYLFWAIHFQNDCIILMKRAIPSHNAWSYFSLLSSKQRSSGPRWRFATGVVHAATNITKGCVKHVVMHETKLINITNWNTSWCTGQSWSILQTERQMWPGLTLGLSAQGCKIQNHRPAYNIISLSHTPHKTDLFPCLPIEHLHNIISHLSPLQFAY